MFADLSARLPPGLTAAAFAVGDAGVLAAGERTRLLRWRVGRLADVPLPPASHSGTVAVAAADADGDGKDEWFLAGPSGRLLKLTPAGWSDRLPRPFGGTAVAALDRRGTGRHAFAVAGERLRLIELDAAGWPHDGAPALGWDSPAVGVWAGPLLADRPDLLVLGDGPNRLHRPDGDTPAGLVEPRERSVAAAAWDAGGRPGLCLVNAGGPTRLFGRTVDGGFRDLASPALAMPGSTGVVVADFDNCGHEELVLLCPDEPCRLFRHTLDGWRLTAAGLPSAAGGCVADLDGDGTLELLLAGEPAELFHAPNANGWLRVRPLTRFGAAARGAVVRLTAGGRTQLRLIDGGPHEAVAHFGLGRLDRVDAVTVGWPDGARQTLHRPADRQTVAVPHPDA